MRTLGPAEAEYNPQKFASHEGGGRWHQKSGSKRTRRKETKRVHLSQGDAKKPAFMQEESRNEVF